MPAEMTAAVLYGKEDLRIERTPLPVAGPGEVIVRVRAALTCGTDVKVFRRGYHARMLKPPTLFGHELAGEVHEVGSGVSAFRPGMRVVALNSAPCGNCFWCKQGQENLCEDLKFNNGAYAEYIRVPARIVEKNMLAIPDELAFEHAALTEPLACVVRGLEETGARPGDTVAVIGAGPIGLMFLRLAELEGMETIAVVKRQEQADRAISFGAKQAVIVDPGADTVERVREVTPEGRGADVVMDAAATPRTWRWAVEMVRRGGVVNFFGGCAAGAVVELDTDRLHYGNLTLKASFHHTPRAGRKAFELIRSGRFDASGFITSTEPLGKLEMVLRREMNHSADIKVAIVP